MVDNKPRYEGLSDEGLAILNEIAQAIMKHLQLVEKQDHLERGEKMVKGLGMFVAGKFNLGGDSEKSPTHGLIVQRESNSRALHAAGSTLLLQENLAIGQKYAKSVSIEKQSNGSSSLSNRFDNATITGERPAISRSSSAESARKESYASARLKQIFSRASQLILEAMSLDGVVFVDACFRDSVSKIASRNKVVTGSVPKRNREVMHNEDKIKALSLLLDIKQDGRGATKSLTSDLLECKVRDQLNPSQFNQPTDIRISQATVRGLMTCYSQGRMFVCEEDGCLNLDLEPETSEICENGNIEPDKTLVAAWIAELIESCPGARTIVFFPLRDPQRE